MAGTYARALQRTTRFTAAFAVLLASFAAMMPLFLSPHASAATAAITQVAFITDPRTVGVDQTSEVITIQTQNILNQPETLDTPHTSLTITSSPATSEQFSADGTTWGTGTFTMDSGTSNKDFYYHNSVAGTYTLTATVTNTDLPEQTWTTSQTITVLSDTTAPTAGLDVGATPAYGGTTQPTVTAVGSCTDPNRPNAVCTYAYTLSDASNTIVNSSTQTDPTWQFSVTGLASGTYTVTLTVADEANNKSAPVTATITVDNTPPKAAVTNDEGNYVGGSVQPQVVDDSEDPESYTYEWTQDTEDQPEILVFKNTREPVFKPTVSGRYSFVLSVCDSLGNCKNIPYAFTWKPFVPQSENPAPTTPVAVPAAPVGLIITQFNSTSPDALGVQTAGSSAQVSSATAPVDTSRSQEAPEAKVETTYADTSSDTYWWILLLLALIIAAYYAYRNWQLGQSKDL